MIGGPSERALDASAGHDVCSGPEALEAAHDPALGLDRSVCLRDVIHLIRSYPDGYNWTEWLAEKLEAEFTHPGDPA